MYRKIRLFVCFINCTTVFVKVKHDEIMKLVENINTDGKDLRIINIYCGQEAAVRVENMISEKLTSKTGVRQGKRGVRQRCVR